MINGWILLLISMGYLGLLFLIALWGDARARQGRSSINGTIYALSLAVYCTSWTFYGSVGRAASNGYSFITIYLGPTLLMLFAGVLLKIIRCSKMMKLNSIADFLSARYGKSPMVATCATLIAVIGVIPYIALQLKAISTSLDILQVSDIRYSLMEIVRSPWINTQSSWLTDLTFWIAVLLAIFTILFGTRHVDASERHEGLVLAIAFESIIKLVAFCAVGIFVTYFLFDGWGDLFTQSQYHAQNKWIEYINAPTKINGYFDWTTLILLSAFASIFLPRQFQVLVVENVDENHLRKALWLFPLYLLVINLFVIPIAIGGVTFFGESAINADTYVLTLPLAVGQKGLALLVFIGGLSAATGMVIVECIALSTMICNDIVLPILFRLSRQLRDRADLSSLLMLIRRLAIVGILLLGYLYYRVAGEVYALVGIGLISFAAVAQFAPSMIAALYWKKANRQGAIAGLSGGFVMWSYTLLFPSFASSGWITGGFVDNGLFGIDLLRAQALFGTTGWDSITHSLFWSLLVNSALLVGFSLFTHQSREERAIARQFVNIFRVSSTDNPPLDTTWKSKQRFNELYAILVRILGATRARRNVRQYAKSRGLMRNTPLEAINRQSLDHGWIQFTEQQLAGVVGSATARVMISTVLKESTPAIEDVLGILDEASQIRAYSQALEQKSQALRSANERLQELDKMKDDFLATISHEFRTPLTSIRAFSELLQTSPSISTDDRNRFLSIIVSETDRLTRLINQVLDLAKLESGRFKFNPLDCPMLEIAREALHSSLALAVSQKKSLRLMLGHHECSIQESDENIPDQPMVHADPDRLLQVFNNLIANALNFSPSESTITLRLAHDEKTTLQVRVEDEGAGIHEEEIELIFDRFYQSNTKQSGKPRGTGLGLAISRQIIETLGGKLWAENRRNSEGKIIGAVFIFELPKL